MRERKKGLQPKPTDPDLLPSQVAFKVVSDEILKYKTNDRLTAIHFRIETDPTELVERLRQSSLKDLLLKSGESLSVTQPDDHYPDLDLVVGKASISAVSLTHWNWQEKKWRVDPNGPQKAPYKIIKYPGEFDWAREIDINIWFSNGINTAAQKLSVYNSSWIAGRILQITRSVYAPDYFETGYEGHNYKYRTFKDEKEIMFFVELVRELFEKRKEAVSIANRRI